MLINISYSDRNVISLGKTSQYVTEYLVDDLIKQVLKISRFGRMFPYGLLNVATELESSSRSNWWYFCFISSFDQTLQS